MRVKIHNAYPGGDAINDFREFVYGNVSNRAVDRSITMKKLLEMLTETYVNISVTERWQVQNCTRRLPL